MSEHYDNKFKGFLNGKGFYLVLALCLTGASAAAYIAMDSAADRAAREQAQQPKQMVEQKAQSPLLEAQGKQEGVKVESSPASSSSSKSFSSIVTTTSFDTLTPSSSAIRYAVS